MQITQPNQEMRKQAKVSETLSMINFIKGLEVITAQLFRKIVNSLWETTLTQPWRFNNQVILLFLGVIKHKKIKFKSILRDFWTQIKKINNLILKTIVVPQKI